MRSARWTLLTLALIAPVAFADEPVAAPPSEGPVAPPSDPVPPPIEPAAPPEAPPEAPAALADPALASIPAGAGIGGVVVDADTGSPIPKAFIFAGDQEGLTGPDGVFVLDLPPGEYEISVAASGYSPTALAFTVTDARVVAKFALVVKPKDADGTIVVLGRKNLESTAVLLEERRDSGTATEAIGAEQMAKAGDSDAGAAVRRVTGVSLVGGRYVYIRGLGERYSSTMLNGALLPSPEPDRRVVPLDLFPTSLMQSVVIQKTYSPDMPGDFGGGVIQLQTKDVPDEPMFDISLSGDWNQGSTFQRHTWGGTTGPTDWLGLGGGTRAYPSGVAAAVAEGRALSEGDRFNPNYSSEELEAFGESFPNAWKITDDGLMLPPNAGLQVMAGGTVPMLGGRVGLVAGGVYSHSVDFDRITRKLLVLGDGDELTLFADYDFKTTTRNVQLGGLVNVAGQWGEHHRVTLTSQLVRDTDDEKRMLEGYNSDALTTIRTQRSRWVERSLWFNQAQGRHGFPGLADLELDWRYAYSMANRLEPDRREVRYDAVPGDTVGSSKYVFSGRSDGNEIFYSNLDDRTHNPALDLTLPIRPGGREGFVKVGGSALLRDRTVDVRRFFYRLQGGFPNEDLTKPPEQIFTADRIGDNSLEFNEYTRPEDNYTGSQRLQAAYALLDLPFTEHLRLYGGARLEHNLQEVVTYELYAATPNEVKSTIENTDVLPAATLTWSFSDAMQVRAGYGRTVARPELREMSPSLYNDVTAGRAIQGNPDLKRTLIDNFDLRWELYPAVGENVTVALFYKRFQDPIEVVLQPTIGQIVTYKNADHARNLGIEFDFRKNLAFVVDGLYAGGNLALISSRIALPEGGTQTSDVRALQGQSPFLVNVEVGYETPAENPTRFAVLYNVNGPRIAEVGDYGIPDLYDAPVHVLDAVLKQEFAGGWGLSFRGRNLLDSPIRQTQGDEVPTYWREGVGLSVSVSWSPEL